MRIVRYVRDGLERIVAGRRLTPVGLFEDQRALARSRALLVRCLDAAQRAEFERSNAFKVRGRSGQVYRITYAATANVEVIAQSGALIRRLCAGPVNVPVPAVMLAQKLLLETQETEFLQIAARGSGTAWIPAR